MENGKLQKKMTPYEDRLALLFTVMGFPYQLSGIILRRDAKSIKAACVRARKGGGAFTAEQKKEASKIFKFYRWLEEGKKKGYLEMLEMLGALEEQDGEDVSCV
jgi:hypothetical protein